MHVCFSYPYSKTANLFSSQSYINRFYPFYLYVGSFSIRVRYMSRVRIATYICIIFRAPMPLFIIIGLLPNATLSISNLNSNNSLTRTFFLLHFLQGHLNSRFQKLVERSPKDLLFPSIRFFILLLKIYFIKISVKMTIQIFG